MSLVNAALAAAIVVYVIARQLRGEPLLRRRVLALPCIVAIVGVLQLNDMPLSGPDAALIVSGCVIAGGLGIAQGSAIRLQDREGLWGQLPLPALGWWLALLASRGALLAIAADAHAHAAASGSAELLVLGVNRLAQGLIVQRRAAANGIAFPADPDRSNGHTRRARLSTPPALTPTTTLRASRRSDERRGSRRR